MYYLFIISCIIFLLKIVCIYKRALKTKDSGCFTKEIYWLLIRADQNLARFNKKNRTEINNKKNNEKE
jgi:hypothetical protein